MDFESITYFLRACELQSLTKAAQELYTTQPTISRRILALEDELGVELLKRKSTGIEVTDAGKLFYSAQKKLMYSQYHLLNQMKHFQNGQLGLLQIAMDVQAFYKPVFYTAQVMKKTYPAVDLGFSFLTRPQVFEYYSAGKLDIACALRCHLPEDSDSVVVTMRKNYPTLLIPQGHRLYGQSEIVIEDLQGEKFALPRRQANASEAVYRMMKKKGVDLRDAIVCDAPIDRLYQAALRGCLTFGGTCSSESLYGMNELFREVALTEINVDGADLCVMYRPDNSIAERFVNLLCEYFEQQETV